MSIQTLRELIAGAHLISRNDDCARGKHQWEFAGAGRGCPRAIDGWPFCSQSVFWCPTCGAYDYGGRGGPGHDECQERDHTNYCERAKFDDWCNALDRLSVEAGYVENLVDSTGEDCWLDFYLDGQSPEDALGEELYAASLGEGGAGAEPPQ